MQQRVNNNRDKRTGMLFEKKRVLLLTRCEFTMKMSYMKLINDIATEGADCRSYTLYIIMFIHFFFHLLLYYMLLGVFTMSCW